VSKVISRCIFTAAVGVWIVLSVSSPWVLSDKNSFLKDFVGGDLLNVLGVILAITLASSANLHLAFNSIENEVKKTFLVRTRAAVKKSAFSLIILFVIAVVAVVVKPLLPQSEISMSIVNGICLLVVLFNILVLTDLTALVFRIGPLYEIIPDNEKDKRPTEKS